jgi:hypothetical protein
MTGLPSDRCPECGKRYDPVLAMRRRAAAAADGVRFRDLILLLAFMAFGSASTWEETLGVAAVGAIWAWLRREALRRRPLALWLGLLAILCAGNLNEAGQDAGALVWLGVASVIVLVEMWRFGWRAPGAAMQAVGVIVAIAAGITAVLAAFQMIAGGSPGSSFHIVAWDIPADTRTGCLMALLAALILLGCATLLWRAGLWVSALAGKPPPPPRSIRLLFHGRGGRKEERDE